MKKLLAFVIFVSLYLTSTAQVPIDTAELRQKIGEWISPNGNKQITAGQINRLFNGVLNLMGKYSVNNAYRVADTLFLTGPGMNAVKVTLNTGGAPSEQDPTVPQALKALNNSDVDRWNNKQNPLTPNGAVSIVADVITVNNAAPNWNANKVQGREVADIAPVVGYVLKWDGTKWLPAKDSVGAGGSGGPVTADDVIETANKKVLTSTERSNLSFLVLQRTYNIGLFSFGSLISVPSSYDIVQTAGYSTFGRGSARYMKTNTAGATPYRFQSMDGQWWELCETTLHIDMFGAVGDGNTNKTLANTTAIQAAFDYAAANTGNRAGGGSNLSARGGRYYTNQLYLHHGVYLDGSGRASGQGGGSAGSSSGGAFLAGSGIAADSFMITTDTLANGWGINGMQLIGSGNTSTTGGIKVRGGASWMITNSVFNGWGIEAVDIRRGSPFIVSHNFILGLNNRAYCVARGYPTGSIRAEGVDGYFEGNEFSGPDNTGGAVFSVSGPDLYLAAAYFANLNVSRFNNNIYQTADIGLGHPGGQNVFTAERFDTNAGHGMYLTGSDNTFDSPFFERNSLAAQNTYDGIYANPTSGGGNKVNNPRFASGAANGGTTFTQRYFINDTRYDFNQKFVNTYSNPQALDAAGTAYYNLAAGAFAPYGAKIRVALSGGYRRITGATPSVLNMQVVETINATATTITSFLDGFVGQTILVFDNTSGGGATTIAHGGNIRLRSGSGSVAPTANKPFGFYFNGNNWIETLGDGLGGGGGTTDQQARDSIQAHRTAIDSKVQNVLGVTANGINFQNGGTTQNRAISASLADNSVGPAKLMNNLPVTKLIDGSIDSTEFSHLNNARKNIQLQLDSLRNVAGAGLKLGYGLNINLTDTIIYWDTAAVKNRVSEWSVGGSGVTIGSKNHVTVNTANDWTLNSNIINTAMLQNLSVTTDKINSVAWGKIILPGSTLSSFGITDGLTADNTASLSNKTYLNPILSGNVSGTYVIGGSVTFPSNVVLTTATQTLANKRFTPRVESIASNATITPTADASDQYNVTALAVNATFAAPSGTPTDGQLLLLRVRDSGSSRTLAWNSIYRGSTDLPLPTATSIFKTMYLQFIYNSAESKWDFVGLTTTENPL